MGAQKKLNAGPFQAQKLNKTKARRDELRADERLASAVAKSRRNDLVPPLKIDNVDPRSLKSAYHRVRKATKEQVERVITSVTDVGFNQPVLVRDNKIVDGHVRVEAAKALGLQTIPVIDLSHLTDVEARKLRLAVNRIGELGEWNLDLLKIEFEELIEIDVDLTATGFTPQEIDIILLDGNVGDGEPDDNALENFPVVSRLDDVWLLGRHRVFCGSALEPRSYDRILQGELAQLVLQDPPYNVKIAGNVSGLGKMKHAEFVMASGEMTDEEFQTFLDTVMAQVAGHVTEGSVFFVFMDWRSIHRVYSAGFAAGLNLLNLIVWNKQVGAMGGFYRSAHELAAVFCDEKMPRTNNIHLGKHGRDRSNVVTMPGANRAGSSANDMLAVHSTPKPVELCSDLILDVTNRGDTVLDAFLGSGTTLIAAEDTGRRCVGLELDPKFVDVIIRRWQAHTGQEAIQEGLRLPFAKVEEDRVGSDTAFDGEED